MPDTPVAIVGGGPVGLGLAIDLALRGIKSTILERGTTLHTIPKGQNLTQRTGEHFRAWSVTEAIQAATPIPRDFGNAGLVTYGTLLSDYRYDWFQRSKVGDYYFAANERLPQHRTEAVLRQRVAELSAIDFRTGCKVTDLSIDGDVTLAIESDQGIDSLSARYVVGCDGARSRVREASGIEQAMDHQGPRMALLVFRSRELDTILERFPGKSIFNVMNPAMDGYWQFLGRVDLDGGFFYHSP
ncbi:MAG: FAD-dependent monooxygenase, partial [Pseudomonadota bacterium]